MATAAKANVYPHIVSTPGIRGGRPRIDGTRIGVLDIVALHLNGMKPDEMLEYYCSRPLTFAEVHAAIAYYYDHQAELEAVMAEDQRLFDEGLAMQEQHDRERSGR